MVLDEWMPWHTELYDFSTIDINREFCKHLAPDLPFYFWTLNERFRSDDDDYDLFDVRPDVPDDQDPSTHPLRLHHLCINRREDASIFCAGHAFLPARNQTSIRQRIHLQMCVHPFSNFGR
ncbi:hypothetical protein OS493_012374 [Desmophyllum pertusum]|uniref:Uncharacterized protein n=1 Tax=Desmophyllum pertusum TaxID=174260 RepID=A0A9X0D3Z1_9CNID|nr:hypothetical protein OS493_012374 [Desmophyllum pertusum]